MQYVMNEEEYKEYMELKELRTTYLARERVLEIYRDKANKYEEEYNKLLAHTVAYG